MNQVSIIRNIVNSMETSNNSHTNDIGDISISYACSQGRRPNMEDIGGWFMVDMGGYKCTVCYIADGHGGVMVAKLIRDNLQSIFSQELCKSRQFGNESINYKCLLNDVFAMLDKLALDNGIKRACGSTLCLVVYEHYASRVWVANCGDSRATIYSIIKSHNISIYFSSIDHNGYNEQEKMRIQSKGGYIITYKRVPRVLGSLAVTRSIGDHYLKEYVISEPDITSFTFQDNMILVLASDGLWSLASNQRIGNEIQGWLASDALKPPLSQKLLEFTNRCNACDNTTIITMMKV